MKCVHGVRIDKPCPDCEYEDNCRKRGVEPENRWKPPTNPFAYKPSATTDDTTKEKT